MRKKIKTNTLINCPPGDVSSSSFLVVFPATLSPFCQSGSQFIFTVTRLRVWWERAGTKPKKKNNIYASLSFTRNPVSVWKWTVFPSAREIGWRRVCPPCLLTRPVCNITPSTKKSTGRLLPSITVTHSLIMHCLFKVRHWQILNVPRSQSNHKRKPREPNRNPLFVPEILVVNSVNHLLGLWTLRGERTHTPPSAVLVQPDVGGVLKRVARAHVTPCWWPLCHCACVRGPPHAGFSSHIAPPFPDPPPPPKKKKRCRWNQILCEKRLLKSLINNANRERKTICSENCNRKIWLVFILLFVRMISFVDNC